MRARCLVYILEKIPKQNFRFEDVIKSLFVKQKKKCSKRVHTREKNSEMTE